MIKNMVILAMMVVSFVAGIILTNIRSGDVVVMRDKNDQCIVVDTNNGNILGTIDKRGGRCHVADWRLRHPF